MTQNETQNVGGRDAVALALAAGATQTEAAMAGGVARSTVARWLDDPLFAAEVRTLRHQAFDEAISILTAAASDAARHLVELACGRHPNGSVRLGAIRTLLSVASEHLAIADVETRLDRLEGKSGADSAVDHEIERLIGEWRRNLEWDIRHEGEA